MENRRTTHLLGSRQFVRQQVRTAALSGDRRLRQRLRHVVLALVFPSLIAGGLVSLLPSSSLAQPLAGDTAAAEPLTQTLQSEVRQLVQAQAQLPVAAGGADAWRVEVQVGALDPRIKLAPCNQIQPYIPSGVPRSGRTRVGLRCIDGPKRWNVSLPVTVSLFGPALVAQVDLPAGTQLSAAQLGSAEVDWTAAGGAPFKQADGLLGRQLARPVAAGAPIRAQDLRVRQWFAAGEAIRVVAGGAGWQVASQGQALNPGLEGALVRVRLESGRMLQARPVGPGQATVVF